MVLLKCTTSSIPGKKNDFAGASAKKKNVSVNLVGGLKSNAS